MLSRTSSNNKSSTKLIVLGDGVVDFRALIIKSFLFSLKFYKVDEKEENAVKFRGSRDLPTLTSFINTQLGIVAEVRTKLYCNTVLGKCAICCYSVSNKR